MFIKLSNLIRIRSSELRLITARSLPGMKRLKRRRFSAALRASSHLLLPSYHVNLKQVYPFLVQHVYKKHVGEKDKDKADKFTRT